MPARKSIYLSCLCTMLEEKMMGDGFSKAPAAHPELYIPLCCFLFWVAKGTHLEEAPVAVTQWMVVMARGSTVSAVPGLPSRVLHKRCSCIYLLHEALQPRACTMLRAPCDEVPVAWPAGLCPHALRVEALPTARSSHGNGQLIPARPCKAE